MRAKVREAGLEEQIEIDSAGTGSWHIGEAPDQRASEAAAARGIALESVARQVGREDFEEFDLILAMDAANLSALERIAPDEEGRAKVRLLREFGRGAGNGDLDVPDPYYGGAEGFEHVLDLLEAACEGLLVELREELEGSEGANSRPARQRRG